jgi:glucose/arabinose dehydrogenase
VLALADRDGDGHADFRRVAVRGLNLVHGIAIREDRMWLVTDTELYDAPILGRGEVAPPRLLRDDLPEAGQHPNKTLGFGPGGALYITAGSTCNTGDVPNREAATIHQLPDGLPAPRPQGAVRMPGRARGGAGRRAAAVRGHERDDLPDRAQVGRSAVAFGHAGHAARDRDAQGAVPGSQP